MRNKEDGETVHWAGRGETPGSEASPDEGTGVQKFLPNAKFSFGRKTLPTLCFFLQACGATSNGDDAPASATEPLETVRTSQDAIAVRTAELEAWVLAHHRRRGHQIVLTETIEDGTVIDWVDRATVPGADVKAPTLPEWSRPDGVKPGRAVITEGPPGALPYARPALTSYIRGESSAPDVETFFRTLPAGLPRANRYVQFAKEVTNYGSAAAVNGNWTTEDVPSGLNFVIEEVSSWCEKDEADVGDGVGVVLGRFNNPYGAGYRLGAEYFINGAHNWISGVDAPAETNGAYVQHSSTVYPGVSIGPASVSNGDQYEHIIQVVHFANNGPAWWFFYQGVAFGYVLSSSFTAGQLQTAGCWANQYSEAHDHSEKVGMPLAYADWMEADMGSGLRPTGSTRSANFGTRAFLRLPGYYAATNGGSATMTNATATATNTSCYSGVRTTDGGSNWNPSLFFGGPGGDGSGCN